MIIEQIEVQLSIAIMRSINKLNEKQIFHAT